MNDFANPCWMLPLISGHAPLNSSCSELHDGINSSCNIWWQKYSTLSGLEASSYCSQIHRRSAVKALLWGSCFVRTCRELRHLLECCTIFILFCLPALTQMTFHLGKPERAPHGALRCLCMVHPSLHKLQIEWLTWSIFLYRRNLIGYTVEENMREIVVLRNSWTKGGTIE